MLCMWYHSYVSLLREYVSIHDIHKQVVEGVGEHIHEKEQS